PGFGPGPAPAGKRGSLAAACQLPGARAGRAARSIAARLKTGVTCLKPRRRQPRRGRGASRRRAGKVPRKGGFTIPRRHGILWMCGRETRAPRKETGPMDRTIKTTSTLVELGGALYRVTAELR